MFAKAGFFSWPFLGQKKKTAYTLFQPRICSTQSNAYTFKKAPGRSSNVLILTEYALQAHVLVCDSIWRVIINLIKVGGE